MLGLKPVKELKEFSGGKKRVVGSIKLFWFLNYTILYRINFGMPQAIHMFLWFKVFLSWLRFPIVNFFISRENVRYRKGSIIWRQWFTKFIEIYQLCNAVL